MDKLIKSLPFIMAILLFLLAIIKGWLFWIWPAAISLIFGIALLQKDSPKVANSLKIVAAILLVIALLFVIVSVLTMFG